MSVKVIDSFRLVVAKKGASNIGTVEADADNDTLTLEAGDGIGMTVDALNDTITITNTESQEALLAARSPIYIRADDSAIREVGPGESFGIAGSGAVTTASNAEGDITITVSSNLSTFTNDANFISDITGEDLQDLSNVTITSVADNELLQYDSASSKWINQTYTEAGFATVSTTGSYNDLSNRPNITFTGDATGSTGGALGGGASNIELTLDTSGVVAGTYNGFTIDAKGRITQVNTSEFETDTLDTVTNRGTSTTNAITVGGLSIGSAYSLPTSIGSQGTVLGVQNGVVQFIANESSSSFNVSADDSTLRAIGSGETLAIIGTGPVSTSSNAEGQITINATPTLSQVTGNGATTSDSITVGGLKVGNVIVPSTLGADGTILKVNNGVLQFMSQGADDSFALRVLADDSTERFINAGEQLAIVGSGNVTTSSNAEGQITITSSPTLTDVLTNGASTTTAVDFQGNVTLGSDTTDNLTANGTFLGRFPLTFEGQTSGNGIFTRFEITDPSSSTKTITFPDATGTVAFVGADLSTFTNDSNFVSSSGNIATATALQSSRNFSMSGAINASAIGFDGTGNVAFVTSFANQNVSQFTNDAGYVTEGLTRDTPLSELPNDLGFMTKFNIGADDSTMREVRADENIKIIGGGAVTTASDAEGNITVTASNDLSSYNNDAGFNTQNDLITLSGDVSGSGRTTINVTLSTNLSSVSPGTYNYVTVDTKGIVQSAELKNYVEQGALLEQDLAGSVFADDSTLIIDGVSGRVYTSVLTINDGVQEKFATKSSATGVVTHDCSTGHIFRHSSISANFTANFTNLILEQGYATTLTLSLDQGNTAYMPTAVQIGGVAQTIVWQGNSAPSGTANGEDVVSFSILRTGASAYTVLGQRVSFGGV